MSWWAYAERVAKTTRMRDISERTGIDPSNFSRWKAGAVPKAEMVAQFARAYERPVLEAFVAAGFLTEAEAGVLPSARPSSLSDFELIDLAKELHARLAAEQTPAEVRSLRAARTSTQPRGNPEVTRADEEAEASQDNGGEDPA